MPLSIIKNLDGLRVGNFIFVDSFAFPPNFITAQARYLGEGFKKDLLKGNKNNCAYLNAEVKDIEQLLPDYHYGLYSKDGFTAKKVQDEKAFEKFIKWEIRFKDNVAEISFIHELQNYYKDWTGKDLIKMPG